MGEDSNFCLFPDARSSDTEANNGEYRNTITAEAFPLAVSQVVNNFNGDDEGESSLEPRVGLEFNSAEAARDFYSQYAARIGFKIRTGQLYRSRTDGSVTNRRFVCSKEGFQLNSRTGCPAFIRVQKRDTGKWVIDQFHKEHNHAFEPNGESQTPASEQQTPRPTRSVAVVSHKPKFKLLGEVKDGHPSTSGVISAKRSRREAVERQPRVEPHVGLEFNSANEAYQFYQSYAAQAGFRIRIGQLFRSKVDGSITSRRFVCSKEGFQHPSRVGCGAYMRIKRQDSGKWVVDRHHKEHNHDLESQTEPLNDNFSLNSIVEVNGRLDNESFTINGNYDLTKRRPANCIGNDWYRVLLECFQAKQAEDTGFFYAVEVVDGGCRSIFWADSRSRFSASQFGDAVVFDTSYRKGVYLVPFAIFIGVNQHRQPVLLGCALVADESQESFSWLFRTYLRATSNRRPMTITADQDNAIQVAIAQVFPGTYHRFSMWQIHSKEQEYFSSLGDGFKYEYGKCIYQSQTVGEFDGAWSVIVEKYGLKENAWLNYMHERRENWVPLFLRRKFFAGMPLHEILEPFFFGMLLNGQTPLKEFVVRYERSLERWREEEKKEDANCFNLQAFLQTSEPIEEQCRRLYTLTVFKLFQKELLQSYSYLGYNIFEEGTITRYLLRKCGNENEKHVVTLNASDIHVSCTCLMFEYEGLLCRHILKVLQLVDIREIPSRYILHRWTQNAQYGTVRDADSVGSPEEIKNIMLWSLRETACKYVEAGATSLEKYKLAYEIMREGGRKLCWGR